MELLHHISGRILCGYYIIMDVIHLIYHVNPADSPRSAGVIPRPFLVPEDFGGFMHAIPQVGLLCLDGGFTHAWSRDMDGIGLIMMESMLK